MILADIDVVGYATVALGILTLFAILVAIYQLFELRRDTWVSTQSADSQAYTSVMRTWGNLQQILAARLWARPYFEDNIPVPPELPEHKQIELQFLCEAYMDLVDTVTEQRGATPSDRSDWSTWGTYFRSLFRDSPVFREWLREEGSWYPDYELAAVGILCVRNPVTGVAISSWYAREIDPVDDHDSAILRDIRARRPADIMKAAPEGNGYPWFRTWLVIKLTPDDGELLWNADPTNVPIRQAPKHLVVTTYGRERTTAEVVVEFGSAFSLETDECQTIVGWFLGLMSDSTQLEVAKVGILEFGGNKFQTSLHWLKRPRTRRHLIRGENPLVHQEHYLIPRYEVKGRVPRHFFAADASKELGA